MFSNNEDVDENIISKNGGVEEGSTPIQDQVETTVKPDNNTDSDIVKDFDRLNIGTIEEATTLIQNQDDTHAKSKEHTNKAKSKEDEDAIKSSDDVEEDDWDNWADCVDENLRELRGGFKDLARTTTILGRLTRLYEDGVDGDYSNFKEDIKALQGAHESIKLEIERVKAIRKDYAKENESLKDQIDEQESKIAALMDENWTFGQQISSLLSAVRLLEDKVDRLSSEVRELATV